MDPLWTPYGPMDSPRLPYGPPMDSLWTPNGPPMDPLIMDPLGNHYLVWTPYGQDPLWTPYGPPMDPLWTPYSYGPPMGALYDP